MCIFSVGKIINLIASVLVSHVQIRIGPWDVVRTQLFLSLMFFWLQLFYPRHIKSLSVNRVFDEKFCLEEKKLHQATLDIQDITNANGNVLFKVDGWITSWRMVFNSMTFGFWCRRLLIEAVGHFLNFGGPCAASLLPHSQWTTHPAQRRKHRG